jgi:hypothetical protein
MSASPQAGGRVPDFFIVGHHKSGTTALYEMLRRHPQIFMPELKEPQYFATDLPARLAGELRPGLPATLDQYTALFEPAGPDQITGEASPQYLRSETAAGEIAAARPDAKIIAIFREPASFVRSLHLQLAQSGTETELDLRRAVENERVERNGRTRLRYSDHVRYAEQLQRYEDAFPREQILALIYDDYRADNEGTVREVLAFLGVDETVPVQAVQSNPTVGTRATGINRAVKAVTSGEGRTGRALNRTIKSLVPQSARRRALRTTQDRLLYSEPPPVDEQLMAELRERYAGEVQALGIKLDRDLLELWGYAPAAR